MRGCCRCMASPPACGISWWEWTGHAATPSAWTGIWRWRSTSSRRATCWCTTSESIAASVLARASAGLAPTCKTLQPHPWDLRLQLGCCPVCGAWQSLNKTPDSASGDVRAAAEHPHRRLGGAQLPGTGGVPHRFHPARNLDGMSGSQSHALSADAQPPEAQRWTVWSSSAALGELDLQVLTQPRLHGVPAQPRPTRRWLPAGLAGGNPQPDERQPGAAHLR